MEDSKSNHPEVIKATTIKVGPNIITIQEVHTFPPNSEVIDITGKEFQFFDALLKKLNNPKTQ